jgi:cation transport regulator ChaB
MDRTAQRQAFTGAIQPFFDAQDASDNAAAKASATRNAREAAERKYNQTSDPGKKEALTQPLLDLQAQDGTDTAAAQTAFVASENLFLTLNTACGNLLVNPGAVEQV